MRQRELTVCAELAGRQADMIRLLRDLVMFDSPSRNREGVGAVSARIGEFLRIEGVATASIPNETYGDGLRASAAPDAAGPPVLLMGHCDTVFPEGEAMRRPFRVKDGCAYGPGVADMKGGLVLNAFVLAALARSGWADCPVVGLFTVDEEISSPWSRTVIEEASRGARAVFNSEPGRPNGNVVIGRKGGFFFRLEIQGKAAHSGVNFSSGINAVTEAAHKVVALERLTDPEQGVTANPGAIGGGHAFNIVAAEAFVEAEVRYRNRADRDRIRLEIERLASTSTVAGTTTRLLPHGEFPPMEETGGSRALFDIYAGAAAELGFEVSGEFSGGCSDAGFTASNGIPTLCGVGPVGGLPHTEQEYLKIDTLVPRAQALALSILRSGRTDPDRQAH